MWSWKHRAALLQQVYFGVEFSLFFCRESVPPCLELVGVFYLPGHRFNITFMEYNVNGMLCLAAQNCCKLHHTIFDVSAAIRSCLPSIAKCQYQAGGYHRRKRKIGYPRGKGMRSAIEVADDIRT